jgi:hypothetical protein
MKLIITILCTLTVLFGCKSTHFTPKTYKGEQIIVGSSGGVTGMLNEFILLDNGQLFQSKGLSGQWKEIRIIKRSKTKEIFEKTKELKLNTLKFKHPGNVTYYLSVKNPSKSNEVKWGESGVQPPEGVAGFYEFLIALF